MDQTDRNALITTCLTLSIVFYLLSLFLPAIIVPDFERGQPETHYGLELLFTGWMGLIAMQPAWLANIFYALALNTYGSKYCKNYIVIALVLALFTPFIYVSNLLIGFYLWIGCMALLLYGNSVHPIRSNEEILESETDKPE